MTSSLEATMNSRESVVIILPVGFGCCIAVVH
jgi:hypothetical protein